MKNERWKQIDQLLDAAFELDPEKRAAFLKEACGEDESLRKEVEALLASDERARSFMEGPAAEAVADLLAETHQSLSPGHEIGPYRILSLIGAGGMGEVYLARDSTLDRKVALKFLGENLQNDPVARKRLLREAQSAAVLDHPFICHVHEIGEGDGRNFIAMEYVEGQTLRKKIADGPLPHDEAVRTAIEISEALKLAHQHHIVHRDLKPSNIMLSLDGHIKIMDFGIAKRIQGDREADTLSALTGTGVTAGTLAYMSPEQLRGEQIRASSDIFSFGVLLYEVLTGVHPFAKNTAMATAQAILTEDVPPVSLHAKSVPNQLEAIMKKMMAKESGQRYESASEVLADLEKFRAWLSSRTSISGMAIQTVRSPWFVIPLLLLFSFIGFWLFHRAQKTRWAREEGLPRILDRIRVGDHFAAFSLAQEVEKYIPKDPLLLELWPRMSTRYSVLTRPAGAEIYFKEYSDIKGEWLHLGRSPIQEIRFPIGAYRFQFKKEGYRTVETVRATPEAASWPTAPSSDPFSVDALQCRVILDPEVSVPPGMVRIRSEARPKWSGIQEVPGFLIDRYEVTNREFKNFVDAEGYRKRQYWNHTIHMEKGVVSWEEAMDYFRDKTGRLGPSEWEGGTYPEGQDDYPVSGVSWYEAVAYAEFSGKSLPTIHHWYSAARPFQDARVVIPFSNINGKSLAQVGTYKGVGESGLYDMAGNVKEWCSTAADESGELRYILGGSWSDPAYMFVNYAARPAWDRSREHGFRTVLYPAKEGSVPDDLFAPLVQEPPSEEPLTPVPDSEFEVYRKHLYFYDPAELNARVESVDDSSLLWHREKISFDAAYGNERVPAYLFLPKGIKPPYQTVVYFPTGLALFPFSSENMGREQGRHDYLWEFLILSGRAVLCPVYKGTYERQLPGNFPDNVPVPDDRTAYRDWTIQIFQDISRSVDYLVTRKDIDPNRLAFYGASMGATYGVIPLALEKRLKLGILLLGPAAEPGLPADSDPVNFIPRVKVPVLMITGEHEPGSIAGPKTVFELLGTPQEHKALRIYPGGHGMWGLFGHEVRKDVLDWLDRYFGKVESTAGME